MFTSTVTIDANNRIQLPAAAIANLGLGDSDRPLVGIPKDGTGTITAIWNWLNQNRLTPDQDPDWFRLVVKSYLSGAMLPTQTAFGTCREHRQRLVDYVHSNGGWVRTAELLNTQATTNWQLQVAIQGRAKRTGARAVPPILQRDLAHPLTHVSLIPCPHCNAWATRVTPLPDVAAGLLCAQCHRAPAADSVTYPDDYVTT